MLLKICDDMCRGCQGNNGEGWCTVKGIPVHEAEETFCNGINYSDSFPKCPVCGSYHYEIGDYGGMKVHCLDCGNYFQFNFKL